VAQRDVGMIPADEPLERPVEHLGARVSSLTNAFKRDHSKQLVTVLVGVPPQMALSGLPQGDPEVQRTATSSIGTGADFCQT